MIRTAKPSSPTWIGSPSTTPSSPSRWCGRISGEISNAARRQRKFPLQQGGRPAEGGRGDFVNKARKKFPLEKGAGGISSTRSARNSPLKRGLGGFRQQGQQELPPSSRGSPKAGGFRQQGPQETPPSTRGSPKAGGFRLPKRRGSPCRSAQGPLICRSTSASLDASAKRKREGVKPCRH